MGGGSYFSMPYWAWRTSSSLFNAGSYITRCLTSRGIWAGMLPSFLDLGETISWSGWRWVFLLRDTVRTDRRLSPADRSLPGLQRGVFVQR